MESESSHTQQNILRFPLPVHSAAQGLGIGVVSGLLAILYRICIDSADQAFHGILPHIKSRPFFFALWLLIVLGLSLLVARLMRLEPMISGGGIAQLQNELEGQTKLSWLTVLWSKFLAGVLCIFGGLFLGRVGPSVLLGAMAAKGMYSLVKTADHQKKLWLVCGAAAGLAGAFGAPVSGIFFAYEGLRMKPTRANLVPIALSSTTAFALSRFVFGYQTLFDFRSLRIPSPHLLWLCALLGLALALFGLLQNKLTTLLGGFFGRMKASFRTVFLFIPFLLALLIFLLFPAASQNGIDIIQTAEQGQLLFSSILLLLAVKFVFAVVCISSGAPGGTIFPILTVGACIGSAFGAALVLFLGADSVLICVLSVISMAGYFSAVLRKPLTGVAITAELTAALHLLPLFIIVSLTAAYAPLLLARMRGHIVRNRLR